MGRSGGALLGVVESDAQNIRRLKRREQPARRDDPIRHAPVAEKIAVNRACGTVGLERSISGAVRSEVTNDFHAVMVG